MTETVYDTRSAAVFLGGQGHPISLDTLAYWRHVGKGPAYFKLGKLVRYSESDLIAYMEASRRQSTSEAA